MAEPSQKSPNGLVDYLLSVDGYYNKSFLTYDAADWRASDIPPPDWLDLNHRDYTRKYRPKHTWDLPPSFREKDSGGPKFSQVEAESILRRENIDINAVDEKSGWTALTLALVFCREDLVKSLIQKGADVNLPTQKREGVSRYTYRPLSLAIVDCPAAIEPLLKAGADPNFWSALYYAETYNRDAAALLIKYGLDMCFVEKNSTDLYVLEKWFKYTGKYYRLPDEIRDRFELHRNHKYDDWREEVCDKGGDEQEAIAMIRFGNGKQFNPCHIEREKLKKMLSYYGKMKRQHPNYLPNINMDEYKKYRRKNYYREKCGDERHPDRGVADRDVNDSQKGPVDKSVGRTNSGGLSGASNNGSGKGL